MSDENKYEIKTKSDTTVADLTSGGGSAPSIDYVPPRETKDQELYHSKSFWTTWVFRKMQNGLEFSTLVPQLLSVW